MFDILPFVIIIINLGIIAFIIIKKFPELASLDLENIQSERETKFKNQILSNRLKRSFSNIFFNTLKIGEPLFKFIRNFFQKKYQNLIDYKERYSREMQLQKIDKKSRIEKLFEEVDQYLSSNDLDNVEKNLIEIVGMDSKNIKAFQYLGKVYFDKKNYLEAKQTYEHALKLLEQTELKSLDGSNPENSYEIAKTLENIAIAAKMLDDPKTAFDNIEKALKIDTNNPRLLDYKFELCIILKDKGSALDALKKMKEVNSENKKIKEMERQLKEI